MNELKKQLEKARFDRALEVCEDLAERRKLLTTAELERLNNILTGKKEDADPWRKAQVTLTLPSGRQETLSLIADPRLNTRDKLHRATELSENGAPLDAAVDIYSGLVLLHAFDDANRRTAVLAAHYFLTRYEPAEKRISGIALHEIGLGDLREPGQIQLLRDTIHQMAKFAQRRGRV